MRVDLEEKELFVVTALASVDFTAPQPLSTVQIIDHATTPYTREPFDQDEETSSHLLSEGLSLNKYSDASTILLVLCIMSQSSPASDVKNSMKNIVLGSLNKNNSVADGTKSPCMFNIIELLIKNRQSIPDYNDSFMGRTLFTPACAISWEEEDFFTLSLYESVHQMLMRCSKDNVSKKVYDSTVSINSRRRQKWRDQNLQLKLKWSPFSNKEPTRSANGSFSHAKSSERGMAIVCAVYVCMW